MKNLINLSLLIFALIFGNATSAAEKKYDRVCHTAIERIISTQRPLAQPSNEKNIWIFPEQTKLSETRREIWLIPTEPHQVYSSKVLGANKTQLSVKSFSVNLNSESELKNRLPSNIHVSNLEDKAVASFYQLTWGGAFERELESLSYNILSISSRRSVEVGYNQYDTFAARISSVATTAGDHRFLAIGVEEGMNTGDTRLLLFNTLQYQKQPIALVEKKILFQDRENVLRMPYGFEKISFSPDGQYLVGMSFHTIRIYKVIYEGNPNEANYTIRDLEELDLKSIDNSVILAPAHQFATFSNFAFNANSSNFKIFISQKPIGNSDQNENKTFEIDFSLTNLRPLKENKIEH